MTSVSWLTRHNERYKAERRFRHLQLVSAGLYSLGHGTNDAQKTMGIIVALLAAAGHEQWGKAGSGFQGLIGKHEIAWWIILSCHAAMALGTIARGLAHRQDHRLAHHPAFTPSGRLFCRDGSSSHDRPRYDRQGPHLDHPRNRRSSIRRWCNPWMARCPLDLGRKDRGRVDRYLPRRSPNRRCRICLRPLSD
jgi:hypothetical protein